MAKASVNGKSTLKSVLTATIFVCSFLSLVINSVVKTANISFPITIVLSLAVLILTLSLFLLNAYNISLFQGLILVSLISCYLAVYLIQGSGLEYAINLIAVIGILSVIPHLDYSGVVYKIMTYLFYAFVVLIILFAPKTDLGKTAGLISFNNLNPNCSSIILMVTSIFVLKRIETIKSQNKKIALIILLLLIYYFQLQFSSRIALLGSALFLAYYFLRNKINKISKNKVVFLSLIVLLLSPVFCYLYSVTLFNIIGKGNLIIMGKDIFTGRQVIWKEAFEYIENDLILGLGNTFKSTFYASSTEASNLHNQMMGCLVCFGIVNMIIFAVAYSSSIGKIWQNPNLKFTATYLLLLIIISYTETIFYSSSTVFAVIFGATMLCGGNGENNDKENSLRLDREQS
ncbi:MAG: O-antigen ligase family protein [Clostridia bacterium]|nr:O-antigen ligase family protein [Clostridia bacterium]